MENHGHHRHQEHLSSLKGEGKWYKPLQMICLFSMLLSQASEFFLLHQEGLSADYSDQNLMWITSFGYWGLFFKLFLFFNGTLSGAYLIRKNRYHGAANFVMALVYNPFFRISLPRGQYHFLEGLFFLLLLSNMFTIPGRNIQHWLADLRSSLIHKNKETKEDDDKNENF